MKKKDRLIVSDHARVRFMERCLGLDIDAIDAQILSGKNGLKIIVKKGVVITVFKNGQKKRHE